MSPSKKSSSKSRPKIPTPVQLRLWVKAAGRCEFHECNKEIYRDDLTLSEGNWAEIAHIVAYSPDGPRGDIQQSKLLEADYTNLMLACPTHHKVIDSHDYVAEYPAERLRLMKQEHEKRIAILTSISEEAKTHVLLLQSNIGSNSVTVNPRDLHQAVVANRMYPEEATPYSVDLRGGDGRGTKEFYQSKSTEISSRVAAFLDRYNPLISRQHLSVFALGLMPFCVHLGKELGDKHAIQLFQFHRSTNSWSWQDLPDYATYQLNHPPAVDATNKDVFLKISLSDYIAEDKLQSLANLSPNVYEITLDSPTPYFLVNRSQISEFAAYYRQMLNDIQSTHGLGCRIHLLLAAPCPIAIQCGLSLLGRKDPEIIVYDYDASLGGFLEALTLHSS